MITPKKQLGQHWLNDESSLLAMAEAVLVDINDDVLEIGPGLGSLTQMLIDKGAKVTAVELDENLSSSLKNRIKGAGGNLEIISQDILKFDFNQLPSGYKIVANIPYYLSSHLLRIICEANNPPVQAALLVQKEVAKRVCAQQGSMSILSVSTQLYFEPSLGTMVPAQLFTPPPKVDSQILILKRRKNPLFGDQNPKLLLKLVKAGFSERRKKLRSSLSGGLHISKAQADDLLIKAEIDGDLRAQNLAISDWLKLAKTFDK